MPSVYAIRASPGEEREGTFLVFDVLQKAHDRAGGFEENAVAAAKQDGRVVSGVHVAEQARGGIADGEEEGRVAIGGRGFEDELISSSA